MTRGLCALKKERLPFFYFDEHYREAYRMEIFLHFPWSMTSIPKREGWSHSESKIKSQK